MDGWMDGWMDRQILDEWMDQFIGIEALTTVEKYCQVDESMP